MTRMKKISAGILPYRFRGNALEVFLVHMGGPLWAKKDLGAWSIAKGELDGPEKPLDAARREFKEETGFELGRNQKFIPLDPIKQTSGKLIYAHATRCDFDPAGISSNLFSLEWPPRSGKYQKFPEVDRAEWFDISDAKKKILKGQVGFLNHLERLLCLESGEKE